MDMERQFVLQNYARYPLVLARGKGCHVFDLEGRRYLDFITGIGVNALGHAHPRILKVLRDQAGLMIHASNLYFHPYQGLLAKRLAEMSGMARVFFCNTGTEGMEGALKMLRAHGRSWPLGRAAVKAKPLPSRVSAMAPSVRTLQGTTIMPEVTNEPLEIAAP